MTENPSRRDSDPHQKEEEKAKIEQKAEADPLDEKIKAEFKGIKRRKILKHRFHLQEKSLIHIFGTNDWFLIIIEFFVLFIVALILIVPYSWLYFGMGIQFPLRQFLYIFSSILTVIGIVGIFHYFFPEWYVD